MPKIAMLLSNSYKPDPRVQKEAASLTREGNHVTVICWDRRNEFPVKDEVDGVHIQRIGIRSRYRAGSRQVLYIPQFWIRALQELKRIKPQIIHCHDLDTTIPGSWYAHRRGIPWIFDAHECYPEQMRAQVSPLIYQLLLWLERHMAGKATHLLTVGELLAQRFQSFGAQVTLIGNYPNLENYSTEKFKITREQIGIEADKFVVAYIGGFTLARAIIPLIEAAQYMPDVTILLAGDGPQRTNIMEILPCYPEVHYVGWIPQEQVPAFTSLADVIYYGLKTTDGNSQYSSPNTLFNAMAAGKPIITTKIGDIARIVEQEQCGVIIDNADAVSISNAMQILKSHSIYAQFSHNAQYAARSKYNWDAASQTLCQLYNRILA